jgi:hypothetical protein
MHHYIACITHEKDTSFEEIAKMLIEHVWKLHDLSEIIVFDRESQFVFLMWQSFCKCLKIYVKLSTVFYSETDDQSEIANQKMKRYLRSYCNYQQNDWFDWLFMIESFSCESHSKCISSLNRTWRQSSLSEYLFNMNVAQSRRRRAGSWLTHFFLQITHLW